MNKLILFTITRVLYELCTYSWTERWVVDSHSHNINSGSNFQICGCRHSSSNKKLEMRGDNYIPKGGKNIEQWGNVMWNETMILCIRRMKVTVWGRTGKREGRERGRSKISLRLGVLVHAFNPSTQEAEAGACLWVQDQPGYIVSSRTAGTNGRPCLNPPIPQKEKKCTLSSWTLDSSQYCFPWEIWLSFLSGLSLCKCCLVACNLGDLDDWHM